MGHLSGPLTLNPILCGARENRQNSLPITGGFARAKTPLSPEQIAAVAAEADVIQFNRATYYCKSDAKPLVDILADLGAARPGATRGYPFS